MTIQTDDYENLWPEVEYKLALPAHLNTEEKLPVFIDALSRWIGMTFDSLDERIKSEAIKTRATDECLRGVLRQANINYSDEKSPDLIERLRDCLYGRPNTPPEAFETSPLEHKTEASSGKKTQEPRGDRRPRGAVLTRHYTYYDTPGWAFLEKAQTVRQVFGLGVSRRGGLRPPFRAQFKEDILERRRQSLPDISGLRLSLEAIQQLHNVPERVRAPLRRVLPRIQAHSMHIKWSVKEGRRKNRLGHLVDLLATRVLPHQDADTAEVEQTRSREALQLLQWSDELEIKLDIFYMHPRSRSTVKSSGETEQHDLEGEKTQSGGSVLETSDATQVWNRDAFRASPTFVELEFEFKVRQEDDGRPVAQPTIERIKFARSLLQSFANEFVSWCDLDHYPKREWPEWRVPKFCHAAFLTNDKHARNALAHNIEIIEDLRRQYAEVGSWPQQTVPQGGGDGGSSRDEATRAWMQFISEIEAKEQELLKQTRWSCAETTRPIIWYRGHSRNYFALTPSLLRLELFPGRIVPGRSELRAIEQALFDRFNRSARHLFEPRENDWETLVDMQHYGIPTRLLDWTEALGVAIAFAAMDEPELESSKMPGHDRKIFLLNPAALNPDGKVDSISEYLPYKETYLSSNEPFEPRAVMGPFTNRRMFAQRGVFTVHGSCLEPFEMQPKLEKAYTSVTLPAEALPAAKQFLEHANLNEFTLFPDIVGVARYIRKDVLHWPGWL